MSAINFFPELNRDVQRSIFRSAGTLSNLSKVCKLFNQIVTEEAALFYAGLAELFGKPCLVYALKKLGVEDKSDAAKIDRLYSAALGNRDIGDKLLICYGQPAQQALELYMNPLLLAEGLGELWASLLRNGPAELKAWMKSVLLDEDLLGNAQKMRSFFEEHSALLCKVSSLNLNRKGLRVLPPEIRYFSKLKTLDLSNNALEVLPKEIGALKELRELRLNYNCLHALPEEMGNLCSLENLQCAFNYLGSIPDSICQLQKLRTLNLSCNRLKALPEKMGGLQKLNYCYLESNSLSSLPSSIGSIPYLIGLYLFNNQISHLPDSLCNREHLKFLSVQHNMLEALPENIGKMVSLTTLLVDANHMKTLPSSVCALKDLEHFSLSCNQIIEFPEAMGDLQKLKFFCFSGNPVKTFSGSIARLPFWSLNWKIYPRLENGVAKAPLNASMTAAQFRAVYWRLGEKKWKEGIDGCDHAHGLEVYDKGLHGGSVEPGFLSGLVKIFVFLNAHPNQRVDADFYLDLHEKACEHFKGKETNTLMGLDKVGVFRDRDDHVSANFSAPKYEMTEGAVEEFNALNMEVSLIFGSSFRIGDIASRSTPSKGKTIYYFPLSRDQVRVIFNFFMTEFYYDIGHAKDDYFKIRAIAKWIQRLEWLHPVRDGCGRTDTALLNYLLTSYGFNPVLLEFPYVSSCRGLAEWTQLLLEGMQRWRAEAGM